jgi:RHS repeat-associated protein
MSMTGWKGTTNLPTGNDFLIMGAREYSPVLGRFLQRDPYTGGSTNTYEYALNDPWNATDPGGTLSFSWGKAAALALSVIGGAILTMATGGAYAAIAAQTIGFAWKATTAGVAIGAVKGAAVAAGASALEQKIDTGDVDLTRMGYAAAAGGFFGGIAGGIEANKVASTVRQFKLYTNYNAAEAAFDANEQMGKNIPRQIMGEHGNLLNVHGTHPDYRPCMTLLKFYEEAGGVGRLQAWKKSIGMLALGGLLEGGAASATDMLGVPPLVDFIQSKRGGDNVGGGGGEGGDNANDPTIDSAGSAGALLDAALGG